MVGTSTAIFAIREVALVVVFLHVHEGLKDGIFSHHLLIIHRLIKLLEVNVLAGIQDFLRSNAAGVSEVDGCGIQPLLEIVIPVIKVGHNNVVILVWTQCQGMVDVVWIACENDTLLVSTDDIELGRGIRSSRECFHSILKVIDVLKDFALTQPLVVRLSLNKRSIKLLMFVDLGGYRVLISMVYPFFPRLIPVNTAAYPAIICAVKSSLPPL